jgi:hypothetical protein
LTIDRGIAAGRSEGSRVPTGVRIVAVDDTARWRLRDDGQIESTQTAQAVDLASRVPAGFVAGGYGVTGGGEFALVYAYRSVDEPSGPRARDARVLLFDLRGGTLPTNPTPATHVDLVDAVGCTVPLAAGETCRHAAHVVVAPGDRSVFVLGPRGVTAAALPDAAMVPLSVTRPARSSTLGGTKRLRLR